MWRLHLKKSWEARVDASALQPEQMALMSWEQVQRISLPTDYGPSLVADWFEVSGSPSKELHIQGDLTKMDRLGYELSSGTLSIEGSVGAEAAAGMRGGRILIDGDAGDRLATGMRGGSVAVSGNAGNDLGCPSVGAKRGMTGGFMLVGGDVGQRPLRRLRRGLILIGGSFGDGLAEEMIAGTIVLAGKAPVEGSPRPFAAHGMRRGTIVVLEPTAISGPRFTEPQRLQLAFLPLLWREIRQNLEGLPDWNSKRALLGKIPNETWVDRQVGDRSVGGMGEILFLISPNSTCHQSPVSVKL